MAEQVNAGAKVESIGTVKTIVGEVKAVDASGVERVLQAGDKVYPNETIMTAVGALVLIEFMDGSHLDLASSSQIVLDTDVFNPANAVAQGEELTAEQIQEMIARGEDPTAVTEATAAGAGAGDEGGSSFIVVDFNNTQGDVTSGFNTLGIPGPESTTFTELPPVEDEPIPAPADIVPTPQSSVDIVTYGERENEVLLDTITIKEDSFGAQVKVTADTNAGTHLTQIVITGLDTANFTYDFSGIPGSFNFDPQTGTLVISGLSGTTYVGYFYATPNADADADLSPITAVSTAVSDTNPSLSVDSAPDVTEIIVDAVADPVTIDIQVVDGGDDNSSFQAGESGTVNVAATFGDNVDGSETHTVVVTLPVGFSASDLPSGAVYDLNTNTVTFSNVGSSLNSSFTVTNDSSPDGVATFTGTATANESALSGSESDLSDNTASASDDADATVSSIPEPSVTLAGVDGDPVWLKEDGSAVTVNVSADTNTGSSLTSITITGLDAGFIYDFSGLDTDGVGGITVDTSVPGQVTITGLTGTTYAGSFTVASGTPDSDADLGTVDAEVVATSTSDNTITNTATDSLVVNTDAVLDTGVDVTQTATPEVNESAVVQLVGLNLNASLVAPFAPLSGAGGADTDNSESVTATVTLSDGDLYANGVPTDISFTGTAQEVADWLESLQVQVPAGYNGDSTITGTVSVLATDTPTDVENNPVDNSYASNGDNVLNFTVSVDSVPVANDDSAVVFTGQTVTINLAANDTVGDDAPGTWSEGGAGGTNYSFSATGENAAPGTYNDSYTLSDDDGDSDDANIAVTVLGGPSVTLGASAGGDTVWLKEDGSAQTVNLSATAATGSHLSQIVITGLQAGFTYNFSGLDTDGAGGITVDTSVAGQVTISGLSGTNYAGTFTVTPGTADSDADLGALNAQVTVAADANSAVTTTANDSVVIKTDAVLDQFGDVTASALSAVAESASAQTVALGLSMSLANAGFPQSLGAAGADTDGSETFGVTITISAGTLSLAAGAPAGAAVNYDGTKWILTADTPANLAAAVSYLQVTVAANFDGTITGTINSTAIDTATDSENTAADNSRNDSANFSLTVTDGTPTSPSNDSITVEEESIPGIGGNNEADGLSYQVTNGDFSNNANWGPDGFGGIVSVNGVTANGSGHIIIDNAIYTLDVVAATGAYTFTLKDNVNSGAVQGENTTSLPTFTVIGQDNGDHDQITFSLNVNVVDDVPVSSNDFGKVTVDANGHGSTSGNVVTNDSYGADGAGSVTSVTFNGQSYAVSAGGTLIHGTYGDLTINSNGVYNYVYTGQPSNTPINVTVGALNGAILTAYDSTSATNPNGSLNLNATPDATVDIHGGQGASKQGFGVDGASGAGTLDFGEQLVVKLDEPIQGSFTFQIGEYNANQSDLSDMTWSVFGADGHLISSGTFATLGGSATANGTYTGAPISFNEEVEYIVFGMTDKTGSGYTVTNISYVDTSYPTGIDAFGYTITDSDGDASTSNLYLTSDQYLNDALSGGHTLTGGTGDDILLGNDGNDILIGGSGDDVLSGGTGSDTFIWKAGDSDTDTITDFTKGAGGDVLDLTDLLQGEHADASSLGSYLSFNYNNGNTTITIDTNGSTAGGDVQQVVLQGVDLTAGNTLSTTTIINNLLTDGNLKTDV